MFSCSSVHCHFLGLVSSCAPLSQPKELHPPRIPLCCSAAGVLYCVEGQARLVAMTGLAAPFEATREQIVAFAADVLSPCLLHVMLPRGVLEVIAGYTLPNI